MFNSILGAVVSESVRLALQNDGEHVSHGSDFRPTSNEDTCAGCGRSVRAPAGRIAIEDLEQSDLPGSYAIVRHYDETRTCALPHGS